VPVEERTLYPEDLYTADEVLISSTNRGVISVSEVAGHKVPVTRGPMAQRVERIFGDYVREYVEARTATSR